MSTNIVVDDDLVLGIVACIANMSSKDRPIIMRSTRGSISLSKSGDTVSYAYVARNGSYTGIGQQSDVLDRIHDLCTYISEGSNLSIGYTVPRVEKSDTSIPSSMAGGNPGTLLTYNVYDGNIGNGNTSNYGSSRVRGSTYGSDGW